MNTKNFMNTKNLASVNALAERKLKAEEAEMKRKGAGYLSEETALAKYRK